LSYHPTRDSRPRKSYIPPIFTKLRATSDPAPGLVEKIHSSLKHLDDILRLDPNDAEAIQLQQALRLMLDEMESRQPAAAD
jgi:hypothetical protein